MPSFGIENVLCVFCLWNFSAWRGYSLAARLLSAPRATRLAILDPLDRLLRSHPVSEEGGHVLVSLAGGALVFSRRDTRLLSQLAELAVPVGPARLVTTARLAGSPADPLGVRPNRLGVGGQAGHDRAGRLRRSVPVRS